MKANYHTHTYRCQHATGEDREYVEHAIAHGMKILGFSDHCPWIFPDGYVSIIRMSPQETDSYFSSLLSLKKEYANDIKIYIGFESEYIPELMEKQTEFLKDYPVDYMILGQHFITREPFYPPESECRGTEKYLSKYVSLVIEGLETGLYRYVAHPDIAYLNTYSETYREQMLRLCTYLKEHNIPVEINLLGLRDGRHYPSDRFFAIASEVGNSAIIGCDAHFPSALSDFGPINDCIAFAEKYGLNIVETLSGLE